MLNFKKIWSNKLKENIEIEILDKHYDKIKEMLGSFISVYDKDYDFILISESKKNWIINHAISYAIAIKYDEYNVDSFDECFVSTEINDKEPYSIPKAFRNKLLNLINEIIEDFKAFEKSKIFQIWPDKHRGRGDLLHKSILFIIKLHFHKETEFQSTLPVKLKSMVKPTEEVLPINIKLHYDSIINQAIQFSLCYESNPQDFTMCRKILLEDASNYNNYDYRLEKPVNKIMKKTVDDFLDDFLNKKTDQYFTKEEDTYLTLSRTLESIKMSIQDIYEYTIHKNNPLCNIIYNEYKKIFSNFEIKINTPKKRVKLLDVIQKSKMNYISKHNGTYIYPFIYDLLVIRFSMLLKTALHNEQLNKAHLLAKEINETKYKFHDKDSNENYFFNELLILAEELPEEYINKDYVDQNYLETEYDKFSKYSTKLIVKQYSQILDIEYKAVALVASRLIFDFPQYNSTYFYLSKHLVAKPLTIDSDYFRALSLNVI